MGLDPYSGVAAVFRGKGRKDQIKLLWCDGANVVVVHKRLERRRFVRPPVRGRTLPLSRSQFDVMFARLD